MASNASLSLLGEIEFEYKAPAGFPVGCPTLQLAATWEACGRNLLIYRPPNQTVSKIHQAGQPGAKALEPVAVTWKTDGQFLAVGWSDGAVRLMGLESNKAVHHMEICNPGEARITHIGWATSQITRKHRKKLSEKLKNGLGDNANGSDATFLDLPQELTFLEVDSALPKISPLPAGSADAGDDAAVFTLRAGIEFLFQIPRRSDYDEVNVMVVGTSDGKLHLSVYDSFVIGVFPTPSLEAILSPRLVHHAAHPKVSTHALLVADDTIAPAELHLVPMDMPFISSSPINISLLTSKLTTLQTLLRYIKQTQLHMQTEWNNARELPGRFLRSVQGDLEELPTGPRDIVSALYHTIATGHAHEPIREWLVESLAERGHKRWDKAVTSGLENLRNLVHENFLPALERCAIILSRLKGFAQFYDTRDDIGFTTTQVNRVLDIISCLSLVGNKILVHVMDELHHFVAFSAWLRFQIERLGTSVSSATEELTEKEAMMDASRALTYIERYLTGSPLDAFFDDIAKDDYTADWDHIEDGPSLLHVLDRQLKKAEAGQQSMKALPHVDFLVNYATVWTRRIFKDIADAKKRSVRFGKPMKLHIGGPITSMDARMCESSKDDGLVYTAAASKNTPNRVYIFRVEMTIVNGISTNKSLEWSCLDLRDENLIDLKFLNEKHIVLLCSTSDPNQPGIYSVPVEPAALPYTSYLGETDPEALDAVSLDHAGALAYQLPEESRMKATRMEVHDQSDVRGEMAARICLLGSNRTTWRTFTI